MRFVTIAFVVVLALSVVAGAYTFSVGQNALINSPQPSVANNVATSIVVNQSALTTEQPPLPKNGSIPQATVACYNYSVPYTPLYTFNVVTSSASPTVPGVTIKVLCNGCGISSDNSSYKSIPTATAAEWKGTYSDGNRTVSVNGICDESFGFDRVGSSDLECSMVISKVVSERNS